MQKKIVQAGKVPTLITHVIIDLLLALILLCFLIIIFIFNHPFEALRKSIISTLNKNKLVTDDKIKLVLYVSIARFGSFFSIIFILVFLVENVGPLFMLWIKELTNIILCI